MGLLYFWNGTAWQDRNGATVAPGVEGGGSAPSAPSNLGATPADGQVALSWGAVSGADTYNIKRSLSSGSGYSTIQSGHTTNSYTDTTVSNDTTYFYRVSAVNTNGESSDSATVSATPAEAVVTLEPSSGSVANGQNLVVRIMVDSHTNSMDTVQVRLTFDPTQFTYVSIDDSQSDYNTEAPTETGTGYVQFVRGNTTALTGSQVFADVTFQAAASSGTAAIDFNSSETHVILAGTGMGVSVIGGSYTLTA